MKKRDDFSQSVKRVIAQRAGHHCSNPSCRANTAGPDADGNGAINMGIAAHITAASPNGPRYDPQMTSAERADSDNGVWLCVRCASLIDKTANDFSVSALKSWKSSCELAARKGLERPGEFTSGVANSFTVARVYRFKKPSRYFEIMSWPRPLKGWYYEPVTIKRISSSEQNRVVDGSDLEILLDSSYRAVGYACAFVLQIQNRGTAVDSGAYIHLKMNRATIFGQRVSPRGETRVLPISKPTELKKESAAGFFVQDILPNEVFSIAVFSISSGPFAAEWCSAGVGSVLIPEIYDVTFQDPVLDLNYDDSEDPEFIKKHFPFK